MYKIIDIHIRKKFALTINGSFIKKWLKGTKVSFLQKFPNARVLEVSKAFFKLDPDCQVIKS